jgi:SAM-dependent methyltransferase
MKSVARHLAKSALFSGARKLLEQNLQNWNYPLTKREKLWVGCYMILRDYGDGIFPPHFDNEQATFMAEQECYNTLQSLGKTPDELRIGAMRKPFWHGPGCAKYLQDYIGIQTALYSCGVCPPSRLLEVGCGSGWVAEFLVSAGFRVLATTIDPEEATLVERRRTSLAAKDLPHDLHFRASAMEYIREGTSDLDPFDSVYVYEALHHAHDWRKAIGSFYECLRPGGWCFVFNEPNLVHTFASYRVGRLSNTHEIGINPMALKRRLQAVGFKNIKELRHRIHCYAKPIWIAAQKPEAHNEVPNKAMDGDKE